MSASRENFDSWFVNVLESLYPRREAGFVILMTAFPLLERYLRQQVGLAAEDDRLNPNFYDELRKLFPKLRDTDQARDFWQVYRNGLLHQGTFSQKKVIYGLASHDIPETIYIDENKGIFCVHPVLFARVLEQIGKDFSTYEGASSAAPPLSSVGPYQFAPDTPIILGTSATPQASGDWSGSPSKPSGRLSSQVC